MKGLFILALIGSSFYSKAQGTSCGTATLFSINGNINNYPTSSGTGESVVCSAYTGTTPVTWFRFVTNAAAECPLLNISASDNLACEVALYSSCNGQNLQPASSMCFADGSGLWAPAENYIVSANTTYYLRIKTSTSCTINIGGQYFSPTNSNCSGATSITTAAITDNNACHKPTTEVTPAQICAFTIENTAFYKFTIASAGSAIMNISNILCDNGDGNNASGFQIGFFTGNCGSLVPLNCVDGSGSFVQATTNPLPAGSLVFVAIDGMAGSNCTYTLTGINVYGVLAENFKNFSGWKKPDVNTISWKCLNDNGQLYVIERSANGKDFVNIGELPGKLANSLETYYEFDDDQPLETAWYRIKQIASNNAISLSHAIRIVRNNIKTLNVKVILPDPNRLQMNIQAKKEGKFQYTITSTTGLKFKESYLSYYEGHNKLSIFIPYLPAGHYFITLNNGRDKIITKKFTKIN